MSVLALSLRAALVAALGAVLAGCGTPSAPQPPSLNLPDRVTDLSGDRVGDHVKLTWTMPRRNTDKLPLKSDIDAEICRSEGQGPCVTIAHPRYAPGADAVFSETLPVALASGPLRAIRYRVELKNNRGRSAGPSDPALVSAGQAPPAVKGLTAEVRKSGVALRWDSADAEADVRLERTRLSGPPVPQPSVQRAREPLSEPEQPAEQPLLIAAARATAGGALDNGITFGATYEYRAQRVLHVSLEGEKLEVDSELSPPIRVEAQDVFPPGVPTGLAAVATAADAATGTKASIDLNWEPNTETDLAGYEVYRREEETPWRRISGDKPVAGPAYRDTEVLAGHTYHYTVSAVDRAAHESGRSAETQETVPNPE